MDFDEILDHVGGFGKYQKRTILLMAFACLISSSTLYEPVFQSYEPDHWCASPELDRYNCSNLELSEAQCRHYKKYVTIPYTVTDNNDTVFSQCTKYAHVSDASFSGDVPLETDNSSVVDCDAGWNYDKSEYESTLVTDFDLVCGKQILLNFAHAICFTGVSVGAVLFGVLADKFGRLYTFYLAVIPTGIISILVAFSPNFQIYITLRGLIGICAQSILTITLLIGTEVVDPSKRVRAGFLIYFGFSGGSILLVSVAYFVRNWRLLQLILASPVFIVILSLPTLHRSPRWLLSAGRNKEAAKIVRKISIDNRNDFPKKLFSHTEMIKKDFEANEKEEMTLINLLRSPTLVCRTAILLHNWFLYNLTYTSFFLYSGYDNNVYLSFALAALAELPASLITMLLVERIGRRKFIMPLTFIAGISCLMIAFLKSPYNFIFIVIGKFAICSAYNTNIIYTSEVYPTPLRAPMLKSLPMQFHPMVRQSCQHLQWVQHHDVASYHRLHDPRVSISSFCL
ncbi:solute carrier family 22 member 2-like isoform X2 [Apostichopus japonicus]|uniref:solute carrier family 22 member 2-like isoform X2 n=1 Tax=Stichopus japonicus TaxID=307972 RepID=UPI003AB36077